MIVSMSQTAPRKWLRWIVGAPPSPMTRFLVKLAIPITSCGPTWPTEHDQVPAVQEELVHLDRDRIRDPAAGERRDLVAADLSEPYEPFPPPMPEDPVERDAVAEEQVGLVRCHRRVRAERGQHGDLAAGGGQASRRAMP